MATSISFRKIPALAMEIGELLKKQNEAALAKQISDLKVLDRCRCGDDFCATLYTQAPPQGAYGPNHKCVDLDAQRGFIILDVADGRIACMEVLYRDDVRRKLLSLLP